MPLVERLGKFAEEAEENCKEQLLAGWRLQLVSVRVGQE